MDIDMPGMNGIQAVKLIRYFDVDVHILMLTILIQMKRFLKPCVQVLLATF
jgi:DNA-binding NarL/FixJ family response regulator